MNLDALINKIYATVENHKLSAPGEYARWLWQNAKGNRKMGNNEYGCADAANILYIIGKFPGDTETREACIKAMQDFQNPEDGLFYEGTHHTHHTTAHVTAALELFDAQPKYPIKAFEQYLVKENLEAHLESLNWLHSPWDAAHSGAGIYAAMIITGKASPEWQDWYFGWLENKTDPEWGMSYKDTIQNGDAEPYKHLYGWFHYLFNFNFAHRPFPQAKKLIDSCIHMYRNNMMNLGFGAEVTFPEIDWVFALNRAAMQTGYRFDESRELLRDFANKYIPYLENIDTATHENWNDLHMLFGAACAVAELQIALPGEIKSAYPLKQILDRRPFI